MWHASPGGLKNAFDWLVSGLELVGKPAVLSHAYAHGHGQYGLFSAGEVLKTAILKVMPLLAKPSFGLKRYWKPQMFRTPSPLHSLVWGIGLHPLADNNEPLWGGPRKRVSVRYRFFFPLKPQELFFTLNGIGESAAHGFDG